VIDRHQPRQRLAIQLILPTEAVDHLGTRLLLDLASRPMGGAWVLDHLRQRLGVASAIVRVAASRRVTPLVERLLFCLVANSALDPMSKLAALEWAQQDTWLPGVGELGGDPQIFYRAMDFLLDCDEQLERDRLQATVGFRSLSDTSQVAPLPTDGPCPETDLVAALPEFDREHEGLKGRFARVFGCQCQCCSVHLLGSVENSCRKPGYAATA
jgi:hypothetical protein